MDSDTPARRLRSRAERNRGARRALALSVGLGAVACTYEGVVGQLECVGDQTSCKVPAATALPAHREEESIETGTRELAPTWERPLQLSDHGHPDEAILHGVLLATAPDALWHARAGAAADALELFSLDTEANVLSRTSIARPDDNVPPTPQRLSELGVGAMTRNGAVLHLTWATPCTRNGVSVDACDTSRELVLPELRPEEPGFRIVWSAVTHEAVVRADDGRIWGFEDGVLRGVAFPTHEIRQVGLLARYDAHNLNSTPALRTLASFASGELGTVVRGNAAWLPPQTDLWRFDSAGNITLLALDVLQGAPLTDAFLIADREQRWLVVSRSTVEEAVSVRRWNATLTRAEQAYLLRGVQIGQFLSVGEDAVGTIFVLGSDDQKDHHALCKIPLSGSPACFRVPLLTAGNIVAAGDSSVYAEVQLLVQGVDPRKPLFNTFLQRFDVP